MKMTTGRCTWMMRVLAVSALAACLPLRAADKDARDDNSPWAMSSSNEWSGEFPKFNPLLNQAGVKWLRLFPEWSSIEKKQGEWNWKTSDAMVANARDNKIHMVGIWAYFAPWASADGSTRKGPIKDMQYWRDYVSASVSRYQKDIKYWEVWNEFNGSFYKGDNKVKDYADLVVAAYDAAKKVDPTVKVGMSVASSDIGFLDLVIKAGAANHFDYICIHPYENLGTLMHGDETGFMTLGNTLRQMLAANKQPVDTPLWMTEVGYQAPIKADAKGDADEAEALIKTYVLSIAQGFGKICWFEARGPAYGAGTDHGIIRADWSLRPAYDALATMTKLLGPEPRYLGWLDLDNGGRGFVFQGRLGRVLAAWSPADKDYKVKFAKEVCLTDLAGKETNLPAGTELTLTNMPVFVTSLPGALVAQAQSNLNKPFPWGGDYSQAKNVSCRLGEKNVDSGLRQVFLRPEHLKTTVGATVNGESCLRVVGKDKDNTCSYFRADSQYVPFGARPLDITVVAKRVSADQPAELAIFYETLEGYRDFKTGGERWTIPAGDGWQEHTWHVNDASFANTWGYHFGVIPCGSTKELLIKEVRVTKSAPSAK